jgi:trans-aconitate 2-methyltransferase
VRDHDALFSNLAGVMRPGARLAAQCGGPGNVANVMRVLDELSAPSDVVFPTPSETRERLERNGFGDVEAWLTRESAAFDDDAAFRTFLRTVVLREQVAAMATGEATAFVDEVARRLPSRELDYVRLNIRARRRRSGGRAPDPLR